MDELSPFALRSLEICNRSDALAAALLARELATAGGHVRRAAEVALVTCELATNIVKHGGVGGVMLGWVDLVNRRSTFSVVAHDTGPPLRDLSSALSDGCDDVGPVEPASLFHRKGLGTGLGAVIRMSDLFEYHEGTHGKAFVARFFLAPAFMAHREAGARRLGPTRFDLPFRWRTSTC